MLIRLDTHVCIVIPLLDYACGSLFLVASISLHFKSEGLCFLISYVLTFGMLIPDHTSHFNDYEYIFFMVLMLLLLAKTICAEKQEKKNLVIEGTHYFNLLCYFNLFCQLET